MILSFSENQKFNPEENSAIAETTSTREADVKLSDQRLAELFELTRDIKIEYMIMHSEIANAGNKGVIFKLTSDTIKEYILHEEGVKRELKEEETSGKFDETEHKAIKMLKIYNPGDGRREYKMQQAAYEMVKNAPEKNELAYIPRPVWFHELKIS